MCICVQRGEWICYVKYLLVHMSRILKKLIKKQGVFVLGWATVCAGPLSQVKKVGRRWACKPMNEFAVVQGTLWDGNKNLRVDDCMTTAHLNGVPVTSACARVRVSAAMKCACAWTLHQPTVFSSFETGRLNYNGGGESCTFNIHIGHMQKIFGVEVWGCDLMVG